MDLLTRFNRVASWRLWLPIIQTVPLLLLTVFADTSVIHGGEVTSKAAICQRECRPKGLMSRTDETGGDSVLASDVTPVRDSKLRPSDDDVAVIGHETGRRTLCTEE